MNAPLIGVTTHPKNYGEQTSPSWSSCSSYCEAILTAGGAPVLLPCTLPQQALQRMFDRLDGLILTGGGDVHPRFYDERPLSSPGEFDERRDQSEIALARWGINAALPLLGICRGIQVMNVALGGSLYQDIPTQLPDALDHDQRKQARDMLAHDIALDPTSRLGGLVKERNLRVNSRHHQALKRLAPSLRRAAWSEDELIEAVEAPGRPFALGVQWHPEELLDRSESMALFRGLIQASREERG